MACGVFFGGWWFLWSFVVGFLVVLVWCFCMFVCLWWFFFVKGGACVLT